MTFSANRTYDIVIPVYNGLDFFRDCYDSVKKHTPVGQAIVIVDDGSSEDGLVAYFDRIGQDSDTVVLRLPQNRGFVHAVNQGMAHSTNHVVLLNSDTEVTPGWLEKLDQALFHAPNVGTVTPWTNKGTICSLPRFCEDNEIPEQVSADEISQIAQQVCPGQYTPLPTAVGFCMAIRRQVLDAVGLFDEQTFGRGYGEENDFCMRVVEHGWINIHDDRTFIFHKGSMTFSGEKKKLAEANLELVCAKHPRYLGLVHEFIGADPLAPLRARIDRLLEHKAGKLHVLFLLHNEPLHGFVNKPGGVEHHVLSLAEAMAEQGAAIPFILASSGSELVLLERDGQGEWQQRYLGLKNRIHLLTTHDLEYRKRLFEVLDICHIDLVHIHHQVNAPLDLELLFKDWSGPVCLTLHDFFAICPSYNLIMEDGRYCGLDQPTACPDCLRHATGFQIDIETTWQRIQQKNLLFVDQCYVPSESCRDIFQQAFSALTGKITVRGHGSSAALGSRAAHRTLGRPMRVGFLGGLARPKGSALIRELITSHGRDDIHWVLIGEIGDSELDQVNQANLTKTGRYVQEDLPGLIEELQVDLVVLCSVWPETFSYTLSECWSLGLPVVVGPLGAPVERVRAYGGGWIVDELSAPSFLATLKDIQADPDEYGRVAEKAGQIVLSTVQEMAGTYVADYQQLTLAKPLPEFRPDANREFWNGASLLKTGDNDVVSKHTPGVDGEMAKLYEEVRRLQNTLSWRITAPLRKISALLKK